MKITIFEKIPRVLIIQKISAVQGSAFSSQISKPCQVKIVAELCNNDPNYTEIALKMTKLRLKV